MAEFILDAKGLSCPLPVLKARRALRDMRPGQTLEVLTNDPGALTEFPAFCRSAGHELLEASALEDISFRDQAQPSLNPDGAKLKSWVAGAAIHSHARNGAGLLAPAS